MKKALLVFNIALLLLFSAFNNSVYDEKFYIEQHEINKVYDRLEKEEVDQVTIELLDFLKGKGELDTSFFNPKEIRHMDDVKSLFFASRVMTLTLLTSFLILLYLSFRKKPKVEDLARVFFWVGVVVSASVLLAFAFAFAFDSIFIGFHKVFFANDDWMLDPSTDNLIIMFPKPFFIAITQKIIISWFFNSMLFFVMALLIRAHRRYLSKGISRRY